MAELCLSCHLAVLEYADAFEYGTCQKWVHYSCTQLPTYMIYQLAVTITDTEYKCESCVLSSGQDVSNKFMEIDRGISTQKTLGNGGNLNDNTINNLVDPLTPANNANIESGGTGPPSETDVDQQASVPNADPQRAAPIQQQGVPQL